MKKRLYGNTTGLKAGLLRRLERIYRRRIPVNYLITPELVREMANLSMETKRQIGVLIDRKGSISYVLVGDRKKIVIPDLSDFRTFPGRLRGLRCIHTHLGSSPLTNDDLTDLALLRLDLMAAITVAQTGLADAVHISHILPNPDKDKPIQILPALQPGELNIDCLDLIRSLEDELAGIRALYKAGGKKERALLVSVTTASRGVALNSLDELKELALSGGIDVVDTVLQNRKKRDPRILIGSGKLQELTITAMMKGITLIVFDQELNPSQIRSITDRIDLKVIDRTQLILDIFSQRARTREGKLQVELAQLKYRLPRLVTQNTAMSRLTGGIGGRGPGETKLEINRRNARHAISQLEASLRKVSRQRKQQRSKRNRKGLPIISIVGYTNAGKSTLLNTLTRSTVHAENRLFATLDPSSRRLRFPRETEVIITDTVGFIRNLPQDLMAAFQATLEELAEADLLLHIIDISNPRCFDQVKSVENILAQLNLDQIPSIRVLNKIDLMDNETIAARTNSLGGTCVCAKNSDSLLPLLGSIEENILKIHHQPLQIG